jgi:hypothetical protein
MAVAYPRSFWWKVRILLPTPAAVVSRPTPGGRALPDQDIRCVAASGKPTLFPCVVRTTPDLYDQDDHYHKARTAAAAAGYKNTVRAVVFDENDGPPWLFAHAFA